MSKRERAARWLEWAGAGKLVLRARALSRAQILTVLTYHRVTEVERVGLFDDGVVDATPAQLDSQIEWLRRSASLVSLDQVLAAFEGVRLPPNPVLITFDDGYRECLDVVLPILQRHRAPAVFFVATDFITERRLYWWDRISYLIKSSRRRRARLTYPRPIPLDFAERQASIEKVLEIVKTEADVNLGKLLEELAQASEVAWDQAVERHLADQLVMTWDHVRRLDAAGMAVESHTRYHRILGHLGRAGLEEELCGSRDDLLRELGRRPRAVAYPVGGPIVHLPDVRAAIRDAGYLVGFAKTGGINHFGRGVDPLDVQRLGLDRDCSDDLFRTLMAFPILGMR